MVFGQLIPLQTSSKIFLTYTVCSEHEVLQKCTHVYFVLISWETIRKQKDFGNGLVICKKNNFYLNIKLTKNNQQDEVFR